MLVERAKEKDRFADARLAQRECFVQFDYGEAENAGMGFKDLSGLNKSGAVAVVLDDGEDGSAGNAANNLFNVMVKILGMNFDPGIERAFPGGRDGRSSRSRGHSGRGRECEGECEAGLQKRAARGVHADASDGERIAAESEEREARESRVRERRIIS